MPEWLQQPTAKWPLESEVPSRSPIGILTLATNLGLECHPRVPDVRKSSL
ncbi:MAG: hypothetical protein QOH06_4729 [Acidobacteriota bacterium]|jgi:hypothetical protein|nr:hypothetical protein [Acidobacteriota bacterium]